MIKLSKNGKLVFYEDIFHSRGYVSKGCVLNIADVKVVVGIPNNKFCG